VLALAAAPSAAASSLPQRVARAATSMTTPRPTGLAVKIRATQYGKILVAANGRTLYLFTRDVTPRSRCYGACASAWPPYLFSGTPGAGSGVSQGLLGKVRRSDGRTQVTYRGHPLYYFVAERRPGQILCQAAPEFGGTWYVVRPSGLAVR
jgi:predicted lipoprotein with Yx(FWY)xxD motif